MTDMPSSLMLLDDIPAPMDVLEREILHPDNIAKEIRIKRASLLNSTNIMALRVQKWSMRHVDLEQYERLKRTYSETEEELEQHQLRTMDMTLEYIKSILPLIEGDAFYRYCQQVNFSFLIRAYRKTAYKEAGQQYRQIKNRLRSIKKEIAAMRVEAEKLLEIIQTMEAYETVQLQTKVESEAYRKFYRESSIYAKFIKSEWARHDECHQKVYDAKGRVDRIVPQFDDIDITATGVFFRILTSYKGWMGFKPALPGSVDIADLISEKICRNLTASIKRPVRPLVDDKWVGLVVDRLGVIGGLPELVEYNHMKAFYPDWIHDDVPLCLGVGLNAQVQYLTLKDFPHYLIAGYTGSGKSNIVNVLITTMIEHHTPAEIRLALIDMKGGLEFSHYANAPHLLGNIIESIQDVADYLAKLEKEMEDRFAIMKTRLAKRIDIYNQRVPVEKRLARICVFFDEVATLSHQGALTTQVMASLAQLTAKGRAVGIHIFLCTQHPSVDIIKSHIKTNLVVRLSGRMPTSSSSVTVLGTKDASDIDAVAGRMVMMIGPDPQPIQTPYISDEDISSALLKAEQYTTPDYKLPEVGKQHQQWTPQRIAEMALKHLQGNVSYTVVYKHLEDVSMSQARRLCEELYELDEVEIEGKFYTIEVQKRGRKQLVEIPADEHQD